MVRLLGLNIQDNLKIGFALTSIYGIGWTRATKIINECKIDESKRIKDLTEEELKGIINLIDKNYITEGELRESLAESIKRLKDIGSYRGLRHSRSLPVRGQRTRSNARTKRGKRKTVGALKKDDRAKLTEAATSEGSKK